MRMITRCPACNTAFRIYQEQLDARQGQVRCGRCQVVFNAHRHLVVEPEPPAQSVPQPEPVAEAKQAAPASPEKAPAAAPAPREALRPEPASRDESPAPAPSQAQPAHQEPVALSMADATQFDFGPKAQTGRNGAGPWWTAATVFLILLLLLQGAYLFRTELARALPSARPALERACALVGCEVPYSREIEFITLEGSELQAVAGAQDVLKLSAVLRNRAAFPQAYPSIELTLTDETNVTVARRVLKPADYLPPQAGAAFFAPNTELPFELHLDVAGLGASGYRLYVFYP